MTDKDGERMVRIQGEWVPITQLGGHPAFRALLDATRAARARSLAEDVLAATQAVSREEEE